MSQGTYRRNPARDNADLRGLLVLLADMQQVNGAARLAQQFLVALREHVPPRDVTALSLDEAVEWYWGAYPRAGFRPESRRARLDRNLRYTLKALRAGLAQRPRFVFCMDAAPSILGFLLHRLVKSEYAVYAHDLRNWDSPSGLVQKGLANASWIVANSRDTRRRVLECLPIEPSRVLLLPPAVDGHRFRPAEREEHLVAKYGLQGHNVLLCVGRLAPSELDGKGYETLIRALPMVLERLPNTKLLIAGSGEGHLQLRDLATGLGVGGHAVFAGHVADGEMCAHYNLCDLFVLPSKQEGFGMVYTEALACGKPVVAAAARGALDALLDGQLGLLIDPDDPWALSQAIVRALQRDVEPRLLDAAYLRETVLAHYGCERFTERVGELLQSIGCAGADGKGVVG